MKPVMYIFLNRGAGMSTGKAVAQGAHAAVEAARITGAQMLDAWNHGGHYAKVVLTADDDQHLLMIERYIRDRGFLTSLIIDEGRTEIRPHTPTALGVEVVDKLDPHVEATFSTFSLYKDLPSPLDMKAAYNAVAAHGGLNRHGKVLRRVYTGG